MRDADNDNEPFPFVTLAAATAKALQTNEKQNVETPKDGAAKQDHERREKQHREAVESGLRRIAAFERRARGHQKPR